MGEFKMPFNTIVRNDIRHIYSGFPNHIKMRYSSTYPTMQELRLKQENDEMKTGVLQVSHYEEICGCLVPRAPAFRRLSRHEIDDMVERVRKPTVASKNIENTSDESTVKDKEEKHPRYLGLKKVDKAEMKEITSRLCRQTKISEIRKNEAAYKLPEVNV